MRGRRQRKPKHYADMFIMTDQDTSVLANGNHQRLQGLCAPTDRCARSLSAGPPGTSRLLSYRKLRQLPQLLPLPSPEASCLYPCCAVLACGGVPEPEAAARAGRARQRLASWPSRLPEACLQHPAGSLELWIHRL